MPGERYDRHRREREDRRWGTGPPLGADFTATRMPSK